MKAVTIILFVYDLLFYLSCSFTLYKMVNIYDIFDTHIILKLLVFFSWGVGVGGGGGRIIGVRLFSLSGGYKCYFGL